MFQKTVWFPLNNFTTMLKPAGIISKAWSLRRPAELCEQLDFESLARLPSKIPDQKRLKLFTPPHINLLGTCSRDWVGSRQSNQWNPCAKKISMPPCFCLGHAVGNPLKQCPTEMHWFPDKKKIEWKRDPPHTIYTIVINVWFYPFCCNLFFYQETMAVPLEIM